MNADRNPLERDIAELSRMLPASTERPLEADRHSSLKEHFMNQLNKENPSVSEREGSGLPGRRRGWGGPRLALAGGLTFAMAITLGLAATVNWGGGPAPATASAAEVLNRAADAALAEAKPRGDQFVYVKDRDKSLFTHGNSTTWNDRGVSEEWYSVDGRHTGLVRRAKERFPLCPYGLLDGPPAPGTFFGGTCVPDPRVKKRPEPGIGYYQDRLLLPTDPAALLAWVHAENMENDRIEPGKDADSLVDLLHGPTPAQLRATVYRALAMTKGVTVEERVTDPAGRIGIGLSFVNFDERIQLVLDPTSYKLLGQRATLVQDRQDLKAGSETRVRVVLETGIADKVGVHPN